MEHIVMQHGVSFDSHVDPQRHLTEEGKMQCVHCASFLQLLQWKPDVVFHSGVLRAIESARIISEMLQISIDELPFIKPNDDPTKLIQFLLNEQRRCIVVTHKPFIDIFAAKVFETSQRGILAITHASPIFLRSDGEMMYCTAYIPGEMIKVIVERFESRQ